MDPLPSVEDDVQWMIIMRFEYMNMMKVLFVTVFYYIGSRFICQRKPGRISAGQIDIPGGMC